MRLLLILIPLLALTGCFQDESVSAYGAAGKTWTLAELDGAAFTQRASLTFPEPGKIAGAAPCNGFSGDMTAPYPWFEIGPLATTRMACPDMDAENRFFAALGDMTLSEVSGDTMILSNDSAREMVFKADPI